MTGHLKFRKHTNVYFTAGSRATVTWRFGFVALDLLNVINADAGVYTCRATNVKGQDETSANLRITGGSLLGELTLSPFSGFLTCHYL